MGKRIITFYEYMMDYPHQFPGRVALAAEMRQLSRLHKEIITIDDMTEMMNISELLHDPDAILALTGSLWCEYCIASGRDMA